MKYDIYVFDHRGLMMNMDQEGNCVTVDGEQALLDYIMLLHMDKDQRITLKNPRFYDEDNVRVVIYPHLERNQLCMNKSTHEVRVVEHVESSTVYLYNTDSKYKADMQKNGYSSHMTESWPRDVVIPINEVEGFEYSIYYPESILGNHKKFSDMDGDAFRMDMEDFCEF